MWLNRFTRAAPLVLVLGVAGCGVAFQQCDDPVVTLDGADVSLPGIAPGCRIVENLGAGIYRVACGDDRTGYVVR